MELVHIDHVHAQAPKATFARGEDAIEGESLVLLPALCGYYNAVPRDLADRLPDDLLTVSVSVRFRGVDEVAAQFEEPSQGGERGVVVYGTPVTGFAPDGPAAKSDLRDLNSSMGVSA